jgi:hypothetical protein
MLLVRLVILETDIINVVKSKGFKKAFVESCFDLVV